MLSLLERLPSAKGEFYWEATDEPHASRRKQILGKNRISVFQYLGNLALTIKFL